MNILIPTADYPPIEGGISTVTLQVSRALAAMGHTVTVVAPRFRGQEAFDATEPARVIRYRGYRLGWLRFLPMLAACRPLLHDTNLVLGINVAYGGLIGYLAKASRGTPYLVFSYAYEFLKFRRHSLAGALVRRVYAGARAVIAISRFTRDSLVEFGVAPSRIEVVLPGAEPGTVPPDDAIAAVREKYAVNGGPMLLSVGRFIQRKNQRVLVQAMPAVLARVPDCILLLAGQGPAMRQCVLDAHELGIRDHVLFPGRVPDADLALLYHACDVFALPSGKGVRRGQVEGFGLVFSEAHACGKPVVAGRSGGVEDAVLDGQTGILVSPDSPQEVAQAILRLLEDPEAARRMGEAGRHRIETTLNWRQFTQEVARVAEAAHTAEAAP